MMNASDDEAEPDLDMAEPDDDDEVEVQVHDASEGDIALQERYVLVYGAHMVVTFSAIDGDLCQRFILYELFICFSSSSAESFEGVHTQADNWVMAANRILLSHTYFFIYACIILLSLVTVTWVCGSTLTSRCVLPRNELYT